MHLSTPAFQDGGSIPVRYTCDGENVSPPLTFREVPAGTKSLALIVEDPDAPRGTFVHWILWGLEPGAGDSPEGIVPGRTRHIKNDFGKEEYGGPCPPSGTHRYYFRLFALDADDLPPPHTPREFHESITGHIIEEATVMGRYQRSTER